MAKSPEAFRTISEVAEWLQVPTHVLRFWESRFAQVKPVKRAGGRRYYRPSDMELLGGIKKLLHDDGLTIRGVQKLLREEGVRHVAALSPENVATEATGPGTTGSPAEFGPALTQGEAPGSEVGARGDEASHDPDAGVGELGEAATVDGLWGQHEESAAPADGDDAAEIARPSSAEVDAPAERTPPMPADPVAEPAPVRADAAIADPTGIDGTDPAQPHVDLPADADIPGMSVLRRLSPEQMEAHRARLTEAFDRALRLRRSMGEADE